MKRNGKTEFYMDEEFVRFYYLNEIEEIVHKYFNIVEVYGDFDMSKYEPEKSRRFIIVLKRK
jgi:fumarate reductase subunit C